MTSSNLPTGPPSTSSSSIDDNQSTHYDGPINNKEHLQQQAPDFDIQSGQQSTSSLSNLDNNKQQAQQARRHSSRNHSNSYTLQSSSLKILPENIPIESITNESAELLSSMSNTDNEIDGISNEDNAYRRRSSSLSSGDGDELNKDTNNQEDGGRATTSLSFTDYGQRRPARRSSRYTNNNKQQTTSSSLDSAQEDTNTSSFSTNNFTTDKKRESWQINTDWDYNYNYDNSFTSQASLYHVLDELDEEQNDELANETKQTPKEEVSGDDTTTEDLDKPNNNNIGEEFELPILQFESSSDIATTFSKPVRNNNKTSMGSLKSNHNDHNETRRSDSNRSFGSKGSSKGSNAPRGRYSIDANDDLALLHTANKRGLLSKVQTQSLRSINNSSNSGGGGGENKTYKRSVQDTLRHDEGLASSIFSRNSDCSFGSVSASDRSGSGNILYSSSGTNITNTTTTMANESWTTSNTSSGAGERLNELDEYWSGTNLRKSQVKQQHVEPWTLEGSDRSRNMNNVFDDLILDDSNKKE